MFIGVDLGGTKIRAGLVDKNNKVVSVVEQPTQAKQGKKVVLNNLYAVIKKLNNSQVKGIGMASRGLVDFKAGLIREDDKLPRQFIGLKLCGLVNTQFKKPVYLDNDVNCFTLAEGLLGAGKGFDNVVGVTLGTGIGGGILIKGSLYRGAVGGAAEFGKIILEPDWYDQSRGKWGTFESLGSGSAMSNLYKLKTGKKVGAKEVEERVYQEEHEAQAVFDEMSRYLALGLANIINSLNPDLIVIGGGVGKVKVLVEPAIKLMPKYVAYNAMAKTSIKYAKLGPEAGLIGATLLCSEGK